MSAILAANCLFSLLSDRFLLTHLHRLDKCRFHKSSTILELMSFLRVGHKAHKDHKDRRVGASLSQVMGISSRDNILLKAHTHHNKVATHLNREVIHLNRADIHLSRVPTSNNLIHPKAGLLKEAHRPQDSTSLPTKVATTHVTHLLAADIRNLNTFCIRVECS